MIKNYKLEELKGCPICGGDAVLSEITLKSGKSNWYVGCDADGCCIIDRAFRSREAAIKAWNTRAGEEQTGENNG